MPITRRVPLWRRSRICRRLRALALRRAAKSLRQRREPGVQRLRFLASCPRAMWCLRLSDRIPRPDTTSATPVLVVTAGRSDLAQIDRGLRLPRSRCSRTGRHRDVELIAVLPHQLAPAHLLR
jgi:hypothetical protein